MEKLGCETCRICLKYIQENDDKVATLDEEVLAKLEFLQMELVSKLFVYFCTYLFEL